MGRKTLIHNALINGHHIGWLSVDAPFIEKIGFGNPPELHLDGFDEIIDCRGMMLLPGVIDTHVHFREPGLTHKATIESESLAARAGGVTSFIDMPNTVPPTLTMEEWNRKMSIAADTSHINYAFMMGASADNLPEILKADSSALPAVKVFMGSSTGNMLVDDDHTLRKIFAEQPYKVVVHAEDQNLINSLTKKYSDSTDISAHSLIRPAEACVRATERAMDLAVKYGKNLHIAHVSTALETRLFDPSESPRNKLITSEVSPHHLIFTIDDYPRLGARIKMNPSIKTAEDRQTLREALVSNRIDSVATDHAPHLLKEKEGGPLHAVSGAPMVQFSLPVMLDLFDVDTVINKMSAAPAEIFNIHRRGFLREGYYADMVLVEHLAGPHQITDSEVVSLCGWTPLDGYSTSHRVVRTWINGDSKPMPLSFDT